MSGSKTPEMPLGKNRDRLFVGDHILFILHFAAIADLQSVGAIHQQFLLDRRHPLLVPIYRNRLDVTVRLAKPPICRL